MPLLINFVYPLLVSVLVVCITEVIKSKRIDKKAAPTIYSKVIHSKESYENTNHALVSVEDQYVMQLTQQSRILKEDFDRSGAYRKYEMETLAEFHRIHSMDSFPLDNGYIYIMIYNQSSHFYNIGICLDDEYVDTENWNYYTICNGQKVGLFIKHGREKIQLQLSSKDYRILYVINYATGVITPKIKRVS